MKTGKSLTELAPVFSAPKGMLDRKPAHGAPCNRCGLCCIATICPLGQAVFGRETGPCPALVRAVAPGEQYGCGLVAAPDRYRVGAAVVHGVEKMRKAAMTLIGASTGCDARFNGEPANQKFYEELREIDRRSRSEVKAAKTLWRIR